jgi:hypothetical protein
MPAFSCISAAGPVLKPGGALVLAAMQAALEGPVKGAVFSGMFKGIDK